MQIQEQTKAKIINSRDNAVLLWSSPFECLYSTVYKNIFMYTYAHENILDWDWHHFIHASEV